MNDPPRQIDDTIEIVTPENIAFRFHVAGPARRAIAFMLDMLVVLMLIMVMSIVFSLLALVVGEWAYFVLLVSMLVIPWLYGGVLEAFWSGRTLGKLAMGIRVVSIEGQPITFTQAVMRNILRAADLQPLFSGLAGLVTATLNHRFQRLGDLACKTMVIVDAPSAAQNMPAVNDPRVLALAERLPGNLELRRSLRKVLADYVQRRHLFSPERRREISSHIAVPLMERYRLPADTDPDLLVGALYYRTFFERPDARSPFTANQNPMGAPAADPSLMPPAAATGPYK